MPTTPNDPSTTAAAPAATPAPTPKRTRSVQNQAIAGYITDSLRTLNTALNNSEIATALAPRGYAAADIAAGITLQGAAQTAFDKQLPGIGESRDHTALLQKKVAAARDEYTAFRGIARAGFPAQGDRVALGITGDIPDNLSKFITAAKVSYAAGKTAPFTEKLTKRGYAPAALDTHIGDLNNLTEPALGEPAAPEPAPAPNPTTTKATCKPSSPPTTRSRSG